MIYLLISCGLLAAVAALPFIKITIYETARGIVVPQKEHITIQCPYNGSVLEQHFIPNSYVAKGDTLLVLKSKSLDDKSKQLSERISDFRLYMKDLQALLYENFKGIHTAKYQQEAIFYKGKRYELHLRLEKARKDYKLNRQLYEKNVIARSEYENIEMAYQVAQTNKMQFQKQQLAKWQSELSNYREQLRDYETQLSQLKEQQSFTVLTAPISGTLLQTAGIGVGNMLRTGTQLAVLSPDTTLCVKTYVPPTSIGFLRKGGKAKFQIDAFDYNQWGLATGTVTSIANDAELVNNAPLFRVECQLNETGLHLKNGFEGKIKKGMTLTVRFELTERTLFQLLYDKVDDWLNPNNYRDED